MTKQNVSKKSKKQWGLFFIALPLMMMVVLFNYVPLLGWILAFFEYKPGYPLFENQYVGLKNFQIILKDAGVWNAVKNTLIFSSLNFILLPLPMIFALLMNEISSNGFRRVIQTVTTLPHFISWVIVYSLAFSIFASDGMYNQLASMMGWPKQSVLTNRDAVYGFQTFVGIWKGLGWSAIIYMAAISGIDPMLYDAARIDGANRFQCAIHVTLPGLIPTFIVLLLLSVAGFLNNGIDQYYVFKNSIIAKQIEVLDLYTYRIGLQRGDYSFATAVGIIKSLISIILLTVSNRISHKVRGVSIF